MAWSEEFPHLYRIFRLSDVNHPDNYFSHMDSGHRSYLATESYRSWEKRLSRLSEDAFKYLSSRAAPYVTHRDKSNHRHWSALFEILNEAKGYEFLLDEGYSTICFIPQSKEESPDIWAQGDEEGAIMEVKTIQRSDTDLSQRRFGIVRTSVPDLPKGFKLKIREDYEKAIRQCCSITFPSVTRRICYFCIDLDLEVAMDRSNQNVLKNFMLSIEKPNVEIIYESRTWS